MFYNKTESRKKRQNNIVTTEKVHIRNRKWFVLRDEKSIVNKWENRNKNF